MRSSASDIELFNIEDLNDAYDKVEKGEVRFRYVINMASHKPAHEWNASSCDLAL